MIHKIKVAVICDTLQEAQSFIQKLAPDAVVAKGSFSEYSVETNAMIIDWIPTGSMCFLGWRINYIYTTKEIYHSEWFNTVIAPMYVYGVGDMEYEN